MSSQGLPWRVVARAPPENVPTALCMKYQPPGAPGSKCSTVVHMVKEKKIDFQKR